MYMQTHYISYHDRMIERDARLQVFPGFKFLTRRFLRVKYLSYSFKSQTAFKSQLFVL